MRSYSAIILAVCLLLCAWCRADDTTLEIGFNNKPPFFYWDNHYPKGILVDLTKKALDQSGVSYRFEELPSLRTIAYLRRSKPNFAALGLNKTPEREKFVIFSKPIFLGSSAEILIRAGEMARFKPYSSLAALIDSGKFTFGGKDSNAYPIDFELKRLGHNDLRFQVESPLLPKLLVAGRFDFMVIFPEELEYALEESEITSSAIEVLHFSDMPEGQLRYLLFSTATSPEVIRKINNAIPDNIPTTKNMNH